MVGPRQRLFGTRMLLTRPRPRRHPASLLQPLTFRNSISIGVRAPTTILSTTTTFIAQPSSSFIPSSSTLVGNTNQLFYQDTGLTANQTYYYYVLAVDQNGNLNAPSNEVNAVTGTNAQNLIPVHISSISLSLGSTTATCTVTVVDNSGRAVSGVEVFGNWDEA